MIACKWVLALLSLFPSEGLSQSLNWSYSNPFTNPTKWPQLGYKAALGNMQSPININTSNVIILKDPKPVKVICNEPRVPGNFNIINTGSCVELEIIPKTCYVSFSGTKNKEYELVKYRFHWGSMRLFGSEHTINGKAYSAECQLIAYNKNYTNYEEAARSPSGLAILVILLEEHPRVWFNKTIIGRSFGMTAALYEVLDPFKSSSFQPFETLNLSHVMELVDTTQYYRYWGSLTQPPCTQNVMWTIFMKPSQIHVLQMHILRSLQYPKTELLNNMLDNYRPTISVKPRPGSFPREVYATSRAYPMHTGLCCVFVSLLIVI